VTGGLRYVGAYCCVALLKAGYDLCIVDDLSKSRLSVLESIEKISLKSPVFYKSDINNFCGLVSIFEEYTPDVVIHAAGLKSVSEGEVEPLKYYEVNVMGTINLLKAIDVSDYNYLIFSSSATVYGKPKAVPLDES
jgi:UDP-glucose 4-epimerase